MHEQASVWRAGMLSPASHIRDVRMTFRATAFSSAILAASLLAGGSAALADKIKHPTAIFAGLDKITGRIITFDVAVDETVQFGTLQITPRVCYTRPPTEAPQTTTFVEVEDISANNEAKRIFSGWMFAASPGLHGMEHPVYDIWLVDCKGGTEVIAEQKVAPEELPPIRQEPAAAGRQPLSPSTGDTPAQPQIAPTPQPQRPVRRVVPNPPVINNERSNDR